MWKRGSARNASKIALDLIALSAAIWAAFLLRFEGDLSGARLRQLLVTWPLVVAVQYLMLVRLSVPRFSWSLIGVQETLAIQRAALRAALPFLALRYSLVYVVDQFPAAHLFMLPTSIIIIDTLLAVLGITGLRTVRRLQVERRRTARRGQRPSQRTLLVGAGRGGSLIARELALHPERGILAVGFVDDAPYLQGKMINGLPVLGTISELPGLVTQHDVDLAIITIASANGRAMRRIIEICDRIGVPTKIIPRVHEILENKVTISQIRGVAIEDLLGRDAVVIENSSAPGCIRGKVVLVTGAGGSIGSELCRQILELGPATLVLVERTENNLYNIHRELAALDQDGEVVPALADVCDVERMHHVFSTYRPQVVFHAAAHKHVPMLEHNPGEAIKNNYFGTKRVADLSHEFRCERFVLVSTDKAVNPTSVMGATKRLAELYIQDLNSRSPLRCVAVRFGNVLGSAGSVIPLFREQIARGGPVTVTHPEMERFFMTIPEASRLVLEAAGLCQGGEVMVLDMGEPMNIKSLAEEMIRLSGLEPHADIEIVYTGIRPGEKLFEELAHQDETLVPTGVEKISVWREQNHRASIEEMIVLEGLSWTSRPIEEIKARLARVLPEYRPGATPSLTRERTVARRVLAASVAAAPERQTLSNAS